MTDRLTGVQESRPWWTTLTGHQVRVRTAGTETQGQLTIIEYEEGPHTAPPVFTRHAFVEVFCVLSGTFTFKFMDEPTFLAPPGSVITAPAWKPHSFWNTGDEPVRALLVCTPAGLDRFFEESHALRSRLPFETADPALLQREMKALRDRFGLEHVGTPPDG